MPLCPWTSKMAKGRNERWSHGDQTQGFSFSCQRSATKLLYNSCQQPPFNPIRQFLHAISKIHADFLSSSSSIHVTNLIFSSTPLSLCSTLHNFIKKCYTFSSSLLSHSALTPLMFYNTLCISFLVIFTHLTSTPLPTSSFGTLSFG